MKSYATKNYNCPFCRLNTSSEKNFVVFKDKDIRALISSMQWAPNIGIVLVMPNKHFENVYHVPDQLLAKVNIFAKKVAVAMKKIYPADGISMRQHNEPAGNQSVWHYHLQVVPRYKDDHFYINYEKGRKRISLKDRKKYSLLMKNALQKG